MKFAWLVLASMAACVAPPRDPFLRAEWALQRHDLTGALLAYDSVPVAHARYPDARAAAVVVERTMRRCHELLLDALMLRGEWRDEEALQALERARGIWPTLPSADGLIAATRQRLLALGGAASRDGASAPAVAVAPTPLFETAPAPLLPSAPSVGVLSPTESPAVPAAEDPPAALSRPIGPEREPAAGVAAAVAAPLAAAANDPVALGLVAVEGRLRQGDLQAAVASLLDLARRHPDDLRVRQRLARLLHQRALLRYGEGALSEAITDWQRVLQLEPGNAVVRSMLESVEGEIRQSAR